jgi:hypothetical protein
MEPVWLIEKTFSMALCTGCNIWPILWASTDEDYAYTCIRDEREKVVQ